MFYLFQASDVPCSSWQKNKLFFNTQGIKENFNNIY